MSIIDIIIVLILIWGAWRGWKSGLVKEVASTLGFVVGLIVAVMLYKTVGEYLTPALGQGSVVEYIGYILAFILIWVIVPIILGEVANVLSKAFHTMRLGVLDNVFGLILGFIKYFLLISLAFYALNYVGLISEERKNSSKLYPYISVVGQVVLGDTTIAEASGQLKDKTVVIEFDREDKNTETDAANGGE